MISYPQPENEQERLNKLAYYGLHNLGKEPDLDVFAEAACLITDCAASLVAMMEADTQTIQSCVGMELDTVPRKSTICQHTLMATEVLVIEDTLLDDRSRFNEMMIAANVRFYAGVPLIDEDGFALGTICVFDFEPKKLSDKQINSLKKLGENISKILVAKKKNLYAEYFFETFDITNNIICVLDANFKLKETNPALETLFQMKKSKMYNKYFADFFVDKDTVKKYLEHSLNITDDLHFTTTSTVKDNKLVEIEWNVKYNTTQTEIFCFGRNVTQENIEKKKLASSERKFRNFFDNSIGLMSLHDLDGNIISVNEKGRETLQYTKEETKKLNLFQLISPDRHAFLKEYLERITTEKEDKGVMILNAKDGSEMYWMYHNMLEINEHGEPYVVSTALNITSRIMLENEFKHVQQILLQTNDVAQVGGWEFDIENKKITWSDQTKKIHGVAPDFIPKLEEALSFYNESCGERINILIKNAIDNGIPYDGEFQMKRADGSLFWVRVKGIPEFKDKKCVRLFGIIQDIDEAKKTFLALENNQAMLQAFINDVPVTIGMFDADMNHLAVSKQWVDEFNLENIDIIGRNLYDLFPNVPEKRKKIYEDALNGISYKNENEIFNYGNYPEPQHYHWEVKPWHTADGSIGGIIIFNQNITASVRVNEELKQAKNLADTASKAKSEFLANMSHEIRTPLNGVIGFSDLLLKTPLNEVQQQYLNYINESGNSLLYIINDILDFSKIESGKLELYIDKFKTYDLGYQVINIILYQAQRKGIELLLNIQPDLPSHLWIDDARIKQVLINLLGNAVKFTEEGEIELKIEKLHANDKTITLRFAVSDTGIGIPLEKQQRIFDAFTQEDSSVSKRYGGTGLGLTISNNILKYMGSSLSLNSEVGKGSVFYFDLEVAYEHNLDEQEQTLELKNVLVVDDNEKNRIILKQMLSFKNIETELAANGFEAIQYLMKGNRYDAILMDYHMPVLSGLETIEKIKELFNKQGEKTPLIVLHTSSEEQEVISNIKQEEKSFCLLKPIKSNELYAVLQNASKSIKAIDPTNSVSKTTDNSVLTQPIKVLLADDNPVNMALNLKMMSGIAPNATLIEVDNGLKALNACDENNFDLILMDVQMPILDGIEATRKIRLKANYNKIPIIGVTAGNVAGEKEKCLNAGMTDFLPKPLKQKDLFLMLSNYFETDNTSQNDLIELSNYLDKSILDEQIGNDEEFKIYFLNLLITELNNAKNTLNELKNDFNIETAKNYLHKLKGTASMSGLFKLSESAKNWELSLIDDEKSLNEMILQLNTEIEIAQNIITKLK